MFLVSVTTFFFIFAFLFIFSFSFRFFNLSNYFIDFISSVFQFKLYDPLVSLENIHILQWSNHPRLPLWFMLNSFILHFIYTLFSSSLFIRIFSPFQSFPLKFHRNLLSILCKKKSFITFHACRHGPPFHLFPKI